MVPTVAQVEPSTDADPVKVSPVRVNRSHRGEAAVGVVAHLYSDSSGRVRKYAVAGGSGDSYSQAFYYYDRKGTLRFTFIQLGAVNGTNRDDRFYFDSTGSLIHKSSKLLHGPGYPGGADSVVASPRDDFAHLCGQGNQ